MVNKKQLLFLTPNYGGGFVMTLHQPTNKSSSNTVSRKIPLDISFAEKKFGKGAFSRTCSLVYSQLKYWWKYAKWDYDNKKWFYKSQKELGEELGMSEKTIWRAIKKLKELGLILVEKQHRQYWRQVDFYHLCYIPHIASASGSTIKSRDAKNYRGASTKTKQSTHSRQNDGIQHKKTNPLEEIIRKANQHRIPEKVTAIANMGFKPAEKTTECRKCRGSGLIDNPRNIAIRCDCEAGRKHHSWLPQIGEMEVSLMAA